MTIRMRVDRAGLKSGFRVLRPDAVPGEDLVIGDLPFGYLNRDAVALPERGFFGTLGRGTVTGPDRFTLDFSLLKAVKLTEGANLQFRAEFFNILNNVNFSTPGTTSITNSRGSIRRSFGEARNTVTTSRQIQFALKILF